MSKDKVYALLDKSSNDYESVARKIIRGDDDDLILYVMRIGVKTIAAKRRHDHRTGLKTKIKPSFVQRQGGPKFAVTISGHTARQVERQAAEVLTWKIGPIDLANFTRDAILIKAQQERASGKGHIKNAMFYERLASPMNDTETIADHWQSPKAVLMIRDELWEEAEKKTVGFLDAAE